ncbi:MAG: hypothetical protein ACRD1M_04950 [Terriglobales bacterium]
MGAVHRDRERGAVGAAEQLVVVDVVFAALGGDQTVQPAERPATPCPTAAA